MVDVAKVRVFGLPVGTFRWDERYQAVQFEYDRSFVGRGLEPSPLMMNSDSGILMADQLYGKEQI